MTHAIYALRVFMLISATAALPATAHAWPWGGRDRDREQAQVIPSQGADPAEMSMRINELEGQIRQLYGQVEQLQFENRQLRGQLQAAGVEPAAGAQAGAQAGVQGGGMDAMPVPPAGQQGPGAPPQVLGSLPGSGGAPHGGMGDPGAHMIPGEPLVLAPGGMPMGGGVDSGMPGGAAGGIIAAPPSDSPDDSLALAEGFLQRRDYEQAEVAFRDFSEKHPDHPRAADALYGLGESFYRRARYNEALEPYLAVATQHAKTPRAPEGLLRLGQSLAQINEKDNACATFDKLLNEYPGAGNARAEATREKNRIGC